MTTPPRDGRSLSVSNGIAGLGPANQLRRKTIDESNLQCRSRHCACRLTSFYSYVYIPITCSRGASTGDAD
jgi:hypothetical protein